MDRAQAQSSIKKVNAELFSLTPSTLITLFEVDLTDILFESGYLNQELLQGETTVFRFHNNVKMFRTSIIWKGEEYFPAPISTEGFELTTKGTLPVPKLSITANEETVPLIATLRNQITLIGDLVGARVTRIRTFAKFLDAINFQGSTAPNGFDPDTNAEFPRDVYYIDRKSLENKTYTEYELSSIFDLEGVKLPGRVVYADRCAHTYRGEGCLYESRGRKNAEIHGGAFLPQSAPSRATANDELIYKVLGLPRQESIILRGLYNQSTVYKKGDEVYVQKNGINYYFVCRQDAPPAGPPNLNYWLADQCSKTCWGCKLRWFDLSDADRGESFPRRTLPFGGFIAANKTGA